MPGLLLPTASNVRPSYKSGFARSAAESSSPGLWDGLHIGWCPNMGATGSTVYNAAGRNNTNNNGQVTGFGSTVSYAADYLSFAGGTAGYIKTEAEPFPINTTTRHHLSIVGTFRLHGADTTKGIFQYGNAASDGTPLLLMQRQNSTTIRAYLYGNYRISATVSDDVWVQIALTYITSGLFGTWTMFVNGSQVGTYSIGTHLRQATDNALWVGNGYNGYANCDVREVLMYDRTLTPNEIRTLYRDPLAPFRQRRFTPTISGAAEAAAEWQPYWGLHATRFAGILT